MAGVQLAILAEQDALSELLLSTLINRMTQCNWFGNAIVGGLRRSFTHFQTSRTYIQRAADTAAASDAAFIERFEAATLPAAVHHGSGAIELRPRVVRARTCGSTNTGEASTKFRGRVFLAFRAAGGEIAICLCGTFLTADADGDSAAKRALVLLLPGRLFTALLPAASRDPISTRLRFRSADGVQLVAAVATVSCLPSCGLHAPASSI